MNKDELLNIVREIEFTLYSRDARKWLKTLTNDQKKALVSLRTEIGSYRSGLETGALVELAAKLTELAQPLKDGADELLEEIDKMENFIKAMEMLSKMIGLVSRAVTLAATV
jgi:hypothetical protein